jgi:hypothetical protein
MNVGLDPVPGWKNIPIMASFSLSLSVDHLLDDLERHFRSSPGKFKRSERMIRLFRHMLRFITRKGEERMVAPAERILFRIMLNA